MEFRSNAPLVSDIQDLTKHYQSALPDCAFDRILVCATYEGRVEAAIHRFKYDRIRQEWRTFLPSLVEAFHVLDTTSEGVPVHYLVTWVPIGMLRFWTRGFNQAAILAQSLARTTGQTPIKCLTRRGSRKHQAHLNAKERLQNTKNVFQPIPGLSSRVQGKEVLLVDDVISTGATANECAKLLKHAGATKVTGIFLARSE